VFGVLVVAVAVVQLEEHHLGKPPDMVVVVGLILRSGSMQAHCPLLFQ
jgi:hypothetical protein